MALTGVLGSLHYELSPADPFAFALVSSLLLFVSFVSCILPTWRASRVDPMEALRCE